ncbi:MAG: hypothetical protein U0528_20815 [Anaerolineae bacterium]
MVRLRRILALVLCCLSVLAIGVTPTRAKMYTGISNAVWSPDGKQIAFTYSDIQMGSQTPTISALYVMNVNGDKATKLVNSNVDSFAWSPDSTQIAYGSTISSGISVVTVKELTVKQLSKLGRFPTWTADGKSIRYLDPHYNLFQMAADGSDAQSVVGIKAALADVWSVAWSPDRNAVAFISPESKGNTYTLHVIDDQGLHNLASGSSVGGPISWSPDGTQVVATASCSKITYALCKIDLNGGEMQLVGVGWLPQWSPDGMQIAYAKDSQLCLVSTADGSERCLTEKQVNAQMTIHSWSPDSRYVLVSRAFMPSGNSGDYRMDYTTLIVDVNAGTVSRWLDNYMIGASK